MAYRSFRASDCSYRPYSGGRKLCRLNEDASYDDGYEDEPGHYPNLEWDPATRQLHSASWSCAHACGENFTWVFDGRAFRLVSYSFYETGGAEGLDLYRAELRPRG